MEDAAGRSSFSADQPSTQFESLTSRGSSITRSSPPTSPNFLVAETHVIVLPGGGYAEQVAV
jgi:hypothetical protein